MYPFFITIDTEGDALWDNPVDIKTENVLFIPRFQELCEKYGLIPIWLTDYEVICDKRYVDYIRPKAHAGLCEVGIHVHARNNPPLFYLDGEKKGAAFLNEYPADIKRKKFAVLKEKIEKEIGLPVISHRAGRWALNQDYIELLAENKIKFDCSVTPGIDWSNTYGIVSKNTGTDYSFYSNDRTILNNSIEQEIVEYPVSIISDDVFLLPDNLSARNSLKSVYHWFTKKKIWLRPNTDGNLNEMKYVIKSVKERFGFAEFMIHSSELMPGGGPHHQGEREVDMMFNNIERLFDYAVELGYTGYTFDSWEKSIRK